MMNTGPMMGDPSQPQQQDPSQMMGQGQPPMAGQMPSAAPAAPTESDGDDQQQEKMEAYLDYALQETNLAKKLRKRKAEDKQTPLLESIGMELLHGIEEDIRSREPWMKQNRQAINLAMLVRETKTYPWPTASNVKFPLVATAAMQFSARAYPALVPSDGKLVKTRLSQANADGQLWDAAGRISNHMSYQILERMPSWEEDMDKLLMTMAISGICFKKTYHDGFLGVHRSNLIYPEDLIVNYYAKDLESAYRKTEILRYTDNEVQEKIRNDEEFLDVDLSAPEVDQAEEQSPVTGNTPPDVDGSTPHIFYQCHTWYDLDGDGYEEPYIITIHKQSGEVVRVVARWCSDGYHVDDKGKVVRIEPLEYFTAFPFVPNPDSSIYALGFGMLLGPLNESVNTLINQLVDAGTLNNLQSGFIGKGLRLKMGETTLRPGEWKVVNATGDDLSKQIFPMPSKEPSNVLFQLMNMLIQSGNQLASIAEIMVGKMPGQNTPASTTQETVQQSMAVFTAIYKRVYRSLAQEFKKIFRLNRICPECLEEESKLSGIELAESDYALPEWLFIPGADPVGDSVTVRMAKYQQVGNLISLGTINVQEYTNRMLRSLEIPNPEQLQQPPPQQPPDPKVQTEQLKQQTMQQKAQIDGAASQQKIESAERMAQIEMAMKEVELRHTEQLNAMKMQGEQQSAKMDQLMKVLEMQTNTQHAQMDLQHTAASNDLKLQTAKATSQQKLTANAAAAKQKDQIAKKAGKKKQP
jgi:chaperonin GroES